MTREEHLEALLSKVAVKAHAGICQFSAGSKHEFLKDISKLCKEAGYGILGDREDANQSKG